MDNRKTASRIIKLIFAFVSFGLVFVSIGAMVMGEVPSEVFGRWESWALVVFAFLVAGQGLFLEAFDAE